MAYTASFGGGFSATIAAQSPGTNGGSGGGTDMGAPNFGNIGVNGVTPSTITFGGRNGRTSSAPCTSSRAGARPRFRA